MKSVRIALGGTGGVGKALIRLLAQKHGEITDRYGVALTPAFVFHSQGYKEGGTWRELAGWTDQPGAQLGCLPKYRHVEGSSDLIELLSKGGYDVLIEATPTNLATGRPALDYVSTALRAGAHCVLLNKGPLVCNWETIRSEAEAAGRHVKVSGAAAAALPTVDIGQFCLQGAQIQGIRGILNGTSNYVLTLMSEEGMSWQEALVRAQRQGIAETKAHNDVSGLDSAAKLVIICNMLLAGAWDLSSVDISGITELTPEEAVRAAATGRPYKLVAQAVHSCDKWELSVKLQQLTQDDFLSRVTGAEKAICYATDTMGSLFVAGGASSPMGAAAAALKDILQLFSY